MSDIGWGEAAQDSTNDNNNQEDSAWLTGPEERAAATTTSLDAVNEWSKSSVAASSFAEESGSGDNNNSTGGYGKSSYGGGRPYGDRERGGGGRSFHHPYGGGGRRNNPNGSGSYNNGGYPSYSQGQRSSYGNRRFDYSQSGNDRNDNQYQPQFASPQYAVQTNVQAPAIMAPMITLNPGDDAAKELAQKHIFLLPLAKFLDYLDPNIHEEEAVKKYTEYKEQFNKHSALRFFEEHKNDSWFREKYHPSEVNARKEEFKAYLELNWESFVADLKTGVFDDLSLDESFLRNKAAALSSSTSNSIQPAEDDEDEEGSAAISRANTNGSGLNLRNMALSDLPESLQKAVSRTASSAVLLIKTLPTDKTRAEILDVCSKLNGFDYLSLGEPNPLKRYYRIGWIVLKEGTDINAAVEMIENQKVGDFRLHIGLPRTLSSSSASSATSVSIRLCSEALSSESRIRGDLVKVRKIASALNERYSLEDPFDLNEEWRSLYGSKVNAETDDLEKVRSALDIYITYLRRVYYVCYYSNVSRFDNVESMIRKCGNLMLRKSPNGNTSSGNELDPLDAAVTKFLQPHLTMEQVNSAFYSNSSDGISDKVDSFCKSNCIMEKEDKFRCVICSKLFRGEEFVLKHINLKHEDKISEIKVEEEFKRSYLADPNRPMPVPEALIFNQPQLSSSQQQQGGNNRVSGYNPSSSTAPRLNNNNNNNNMMMMNQAPPGNRRMNYGGGSSYGSHNHHHHRSHHSNDNLPYSRPSSYSNRNPSSSSYSRPPQRSNRSDSISSSNPESFVNAIANNLSAPPPPGRVIHSYDDLDDVPQGESLEISYD